MQVEFIRFYDEQSQKTYKWLKGDLGREPTIKELLNKWCPITYVYKVLGFGDEYEAERVFILRKKDA